MKSSKNLKKLLLMAGIFLLIMAAVSAIFFYNKYSASQKLLKEASSSSKDEEVASLVERVGKLIKLPEGEQPIVATVSDKEKLNDQPFFANAKNGDKMLIYNQAKKVILYDPEANLILEVGPIYTASPSSTIQENLLTVAIYNGTETTGLAKMAKEEITRNFEDFEVVIEDDAKKRDYTRTLVVDLTGNNQSAAQRLADLFKGEVSALPEGEQRPVVPGSGELVGLLVITGKKYSAD